MSKLPAVVRSPAMTLAEAKELAMAERNSWTGEKYDLVEIFGASGALPRGFENSGFRPADSFDVSSSTLPSIVFFYCLKLDPING